MPGSNGMARSAAYSFAFAVAVIGFDGDPGIEAVIVDGLTPLSASVTVATTWMEVLLPTKYGGVPAFGWEIVTAGALPSCAMVTFLTCAVGAAVPSSALAVSVTVAPSRAASLAIGTAKVWLALGAFAVND